VILDYLHHHPDLGAGAHIAGQGAVIGRSRSALSHAVSGW